MKALWEFLVELWHVDDPPDRIGPIGFAIMGVFLVFCGVVWFFHSVPHR